MIAAFYVLNYGLNCVYNYGINCVYRLIRFSAF